MHYWNKNALLSQTGICCECAPFYSPFYSDLTQTNEIKLRFDSDICVKKWRLEPLGSIVNCLTWKVLFLVNVTIFMTFPTLEKIWKMTSSVTGYTMCSTITLSVLG